MRAAGTRSASSPARTSSARPSRGAGSQSFPANTACGASAGGWGITLSSNQLDDGNDFGNYRNATKTGIKFEDMTANGVFDQQGFPNDPGLQGWTIQAFVDANGNRVRDAGEKTAAA